MDEQRRQFLQQRTEDVLRSCKRPAEMRKLVEILIKRGGEYVILPMIEEDLDALLTRGKTMRRHVIRKKGTPSHCHSNTANLYEANKPYARCCTGYALSSDGVWRQHSWLLWNNQIVETTDPRTKYFGYVMTRKESDQFSLSNYI